MLSSLPSLLLPLALSASLASLGLGAVIGSANPNNTTQAASATDAAASLNPALNLDATTPDELLRILKGIARPELPVPSMETTRPIYAHINAANDLAIQGWGYPEGYKACNDDIKDALFSFPVNCTEPSEQSKDYRFHGLSRTLQRRASLPTCFSIPVRCIDPKTVPKTAQELMDRVNKLLTSHEASSDGFWVTQIIMAPTALVRELGKECSYQPDNIRSLSDGASVAVWLSKANKPVVVECF
ncbi:MAG: hypothetical protein DHS80DRAFT_24677 [Piptocephalis tieghemiana]|nr:MAG: hypothetical protein DHS80DRAFT_24677 [Piptocephalis tieghemiana]